MTAGKDNAVEPLVESECGMDSVDRQSSCYIICVDVIKLMLWVFLLKETVQLLLCRWGIDGSILSPCQASCSGT